MVVKKKDAPNVEELEKIRSDRKAKYAVSIRYREGGVDKFHGVKSAGVKDNTLEIVETCSITTYIVLDMVSYFKVEKEE